jgi:adenylate cyclase, class 2
MLFEVEQKFQVSDEKSLRSGLAKLGGEFGAPVVQIDRYFNHPARDFAQTDEALRIRSVGDRNFVTYKGPKIDTTTKTRREIELPLDSGAQAADRFGELLLALGFHHVAEVKKRRRKAAVQVDGREVEVAYDEVERVGVFAELECSAEEGDLAAAKAIIAKLAADLDLTQNERRSYLELLLESRDPQNT